MKHPSTDSCSIIQVEEEESKTQRKARRSEGPKEELRVKVDWEEEGFHRNSFAQFNI